MKIKLNGEDTTLEQESVTITELLAIKDVKMPEMVSVEYNGDILDREQFANTQVNEGDQVEFLYFMGGG
jgi:sulfur carrier protein